MPIPFHEGPLPKPGDAETHLLDFKTRPSAKGSWKLACNVAAMANADGGTIIVGACEVQGTDLLDKYDGVDRATAEGWAKEYLDAISDRCSPGLAVPRPRIVALDHDRSKHVILVDVPPSVAVIGVKISGESLEGFGGQSWMFPVRVNTSTTHISPERLPMMMVPEIRRIVIMLRTILADPLNAVGTGNAYIKYRKGSTFKVSYTQGNGSRIVSVDEEANTVVFAVPGVPGPAAFALDEINSVHRIVGGWVVTLKQDSAATS
jgi:hypothetical protein